jgi:hypothetical protein
MTGFQLVSGALVHVSQEDDRAATATSMSVATLDQLHRQVSDVGYDSALAPVDRVDSSNWEQFLLGYSTPENNFADWVDNNHNYDVPNALPIYQRWGYEISTYPSPGNNFAGGLTCYTLSLVEAGRIFRNHLHQPLQGFVLKLQLKRVLHQMTPSGVWYRMRGTYRMIDQFTWSEHWLNVASDGEFKFAYPGWIWLNGEPTRGVKFYGMIAFAMKRASLVLKLQAVYRGHLVRKVCSFDITPEFTVASDRALHRHGASASDPQNSKRPREVHRFKTFVDRESLRV